MVDEIISDQDLIFDVRSPRRCDQMDVQQMQWSPNEMNLTTFIVPYIRIRPLT